MNAVMRSEIRKLSSDEKEQLLDELSRLINENKFVNLKIFESLSMKKCFSALETKYNQVLSLLEEIKSGLEVV